jgi:type I restriction enzyme, S subunit
MARGLALAERVEGLSKADGPWPLPEGWCWVALGALGTWMGGGTPSKANAAFWTNGTVPWVSPKDMKVAVIGETEDKVTAAAVEGSSTKYVPEGSVLMVMRSGILKHSFPVAITDRIVTLNQDLRALTPYAGISSKYIARYLALATNRVLDDCSKDGTTVNSIEVSALERLMFPLAPLAEQRRVVARVDSLFAEIAEGEAALVGARKGLDKFRRALLKAAVTGELTKDWRDANLASETGSDLLARIACRRASNARGRRAIAPPPDTSLFPPLPEGWAWAMLGNLLGHLTSGSRDWAEYYDRGSKVFVMAQNVRPGRYNHSYVKYVDPPDHLKDVERSRIQRDDLLVTIVGANTGDVCRIDFDAKEHFVCQSVALMRPVLPQIAAYLEMYLVAPDGGRGQMDKVIYGAGRPHLSFEQIESFAIPIPPPAEIVEILRRVSDALSASSDTLAVLDAEAADAARLKQSVLKAAFEGRLTAQSPTDEPAGALLNRPTATQSVTRVSRGRIRKTDA